MQRRTRAVAALGFLGCLLVAAFPFSVEVMHPSLSSWFDNHLGFWRRPAGRDLSAALALIGSVLMFWCWTRLHPSVSGLRTRGLVAIGVLWTLPLLVVPPFSTADPYAYAAQGWILSQGRNPYLVPMGTPSPFSFGVYPAWAPTTAVYPPWALFVQQFVVEATGAHWYWSVAAMRLIAIAGVVLMVAIAGPLARAVGADTSLARWAIAVNPLVILQLIGGSHNDALMIGVMMVALWAARRYGLIAGALGIGVATCFKQAAALAGLAVVLLAMQRRPPALPESPPEQDFSARRRPASLRWHLAVLWRTCVAAAIAGGFFAVTSKLSGIGLGWLRDSAGSPGLVISHAPISWLSQLAVGPLGLDPDTVTTVVSGLCALAMLVAGVWLYLRLAHRRPMTLGAGALLAFGLLSPAVQPWYVLWGGPLLAFERQRAWVSQAAVSVVLLLLCSTIIQHWIGPPVAIPIAAVIAAAWYVKGPRIGSTSAGTTTRSRAVSA